MEKRVWVEIVTHPEDNDRCSRDCVFCIGVMKASNNVFCHVFGTDDDPNDDGINEEDIKYNVDDNGNFLLDDTMIIKRSVNCLGREFSFQSDVL